MQLRGSLNDSPRTVTAGVVLALALIVGTLAQFVTAARGIYLSTAHFNPSDIAEVPGQTLAAVRTRGHIALSLAVLPFVAGAVACTTCLLSGRGRRASFRITAVAVAGLDVLALAYAVLGGA